MPEVGKPQSQQGGRQVALVVDEGAKRSPPPSWARASLGWHADRAAVLIYSVFWVLLGLVAYFLPIASPGGYTFWVPVASGYGTGLALLLAVAWLGDTRAVPFVTRAGHRSVAVTGRARPVAGGAAGRGVHMSSTGDSPYGVLLGNTPPEGGGKYAYAYAWPDFAALVRQGDAHPIGIDKYLADAGAGRLPARSKGTTSMRRPGLRALELRGETLADASYYLAYVMITWTFYITTSRIGGTSPAAVSEGIEWNLLAFSTALLAGGSQLSTRDEDSYRYSIFVRQRLLILAVSISIAAVLHALRP